MLPVLVVSQDSRLLECVENALRRQGMWAVSLKDAAQVTAEGGFRPRAIVVDPAALLEPGSDKLVRCLAALPALTGIPAFSVSSAAKRDELAWLLGALHRLEEGDESPYTA